MDSFDYQQMGSNDSIRAPKYDKQNQAPMPSREELLARNSFGSPNDNKHLDRMLGKDK